MPKAIVLMTALVPTIGHQYLIEFASKFIFPNDLHVILCSRSSEPITGITRLISLMNTFRNRGNIKFNHYMQDDAPQNPTQHFDFWNVWKKIINECVPNIKSDDFVIASEKYGMDLARALGCNFVPCDIARQVFPISGTEVRKDLLANWKYILPEFRKNLQLTVTTFGAESTGKTIMAKALARELNGHFIPEWAREYLETIGPDVTAEKMVNITNAQWASQKAAKELAGDKPFIIQDTDLLSTIGYYRIYNGDIPDDAKQNIMTKFKATKSDLYFNMSDGIPFEPDILRYGGYKRESDQTFWSDLLREYDCKFANIFNFSHDEQLFHCKNCVLDEFNKRTKAIKEFVRD